MDQPDDVDYWRSFIEDYTLKITEYLLEFTTQISLRLSCIGEFEKFKDGTRSEPITMNSKYPSRINRHASRENKIKAAFLAVHDPNGFSQLLMEQFGSEIGTLEVYHRFTLMIEFPYEYNAQALPQAIVFTSVKFPTSSITTRVTVTRTVSSTASSRDRKNVSTASP
jgi:hypothetical protein